MKSFKIFIPFLALVGLLALLVACSKSGSTSTENDQIYTCSMHPQVRHKGPGNCPICGMTLVPLQSATPSVSDSTAAKNVTATGNEPAVVPSTTLPNEVVIDAARSSVSSIKIEPAVERDLTRTLHLFGEIQYISDRHVDFTWYYGGRIEKVLVDFNTTEVKKGQPLFEIYSEGAIADEEAYLEALRERYLSTFYERSVLTARIEALASGLRKIGFDDASLKDLVEKKQVQRTFIIRAPITGSIVGDIPHTGERITSDSVMLHITDLSAVWFSAEVFEQDLAAVKLGQKIEISSKARPGVTYTGTLVFIDRRLNPDKRTVRARFEVPNPRFELLPQLSATGTLEIKVGQTPVTVPSSAVIDTGKRRLVYVQTNGDRYELRDVQTGGEGRTTEGDALYTAITSGVKQGENVVTGGAFLIDAEAQLQGSAGSGASAPESTPTLTPSPASGEHQH